MLNTVFVLSIVGMLECCLAITYPRKILNILSKFEIVDFELDAPKKEVAQMRTFAVADLLTRVVLPAMLLFSPFKRFNTYAWILIAEFLLGDILSINVPKDKKHYMLIVISAVKLCIFMDVARACFFSIFLQ